jgi:hypothetical protein
MKLLIVAMLLTVVQAPARAPKKAPDSTTVKKASPAPPQAPANTDTAKPSPEVPQPEYKLTVHEIPPVTVKKDWTDWGIWVFSGLLVIVGFLQWKVLRTQAKLLREHAGHFESLANATKDNAQAARENAQAVMGSERAWILVRMRPSGPRKKGNQWYWANGTPLTVLEVMTNMHKPELIGYMVKNYGRTPGWVTSQWATAKIVETESQLPQPPDYFCKPASIFVRKSNAAYVPGYRRRNRIFIPSDDLTPVASRTSFLYVYGIITYRDIAGGNHETRFCFRWHVPDTDDIDPQAFYREGPEGYNGET